MTSPTPEQNPHIGSTLDSFLEEEGILESATLKARLRVELMEIRAKARFEQEHPTGLHMTCLSLIEKAAGRALQLIGE